jgi:hypothetical protein
VTEASSDPSQEAEQHDRPADQSRFRSTQKNASASAAGVGAAAISFLVTGQPGHAVSTSYYRLTTTPFDGNADNFIRSPLINSSTMRAGFLLLKMQQLKKLFPDL